MNHDDIVAVMGDRPFTTAVYSDYVKNVKAPQTHAKPDPEDGTDGPDGQDGQDNQGGPDGSDGQESEAARPRDDKTGGGS